MVRRTASIVKVADFNRSRIAGHLFAALMTSTALGATLTALPAAAQQTAPADAAAAFSLPAQPLRSALDAFSRQTGWQIGYPGTLTDGRTSRRVSGSMPPAKALETLLAGTGVTYRLTGPATATLAPAPIASSGDTMALGPVSVSAAAPAPGGPAQIVIGKEELERKNPSDIRDVFAGEP